jgi:hypothetical protein
VRTAQQPEFIAFGYHASSCLLDIHVGTPSPHSWCRTHAPMNTEVIPVRTLWGARESGKADFPIPSARQGVGRTGRPEYCSAPIELSTARMSEFPAADAVFGNSPYQVRDLSERLTNR